MCPDYWGGPLQGCVLITGVGHYRGGPLQGCVLITGVGHYRGVS